MSHSANNQKASVAAALDSVVQNFNDLPGEKRQDFLSGLVVLSVQVMRALHGEQFVRDYLTAAMADLDKPPILQPITAH